MVSCAYRKKPTDLPTCGLLVQPGSAFCPRHTFLHNLDVKAKADKEQEKAAKLGKAMPNTRRALITLGYTFIGNNTCRDCGVPIEWWKTPKLRHAPFDPMPNEDSHSTSHFATCVNAAHNNHNRRAS